MKILAFGKIAEVMGRSDWEENGLEDTVALKERLTTSFPQLKELNFKLALDQELVEGNRSLEGVREVALLPPFSGG